MAKYGMPLKVIEGLLHGNTNQTVYEKENGIVSEGAKLIQDAGDIKFYAVKKSDNTNTLTIVFRVGIKSDTWFMWRITENQVLTLERKLADIYHALNDKNTAEKLRGGMIDGDDPHPPGKFIERTQPPEQGDLFVTSETEGKFFCTGGRKD